MRSVLLKKLALTILAFCVASCSKDEPASYTRRSTYGYDYGGGPISFKDDAKTNTKLEANELDLSFLDLAGNKVSLLDFKGKRNVVLVITRGFAGELCPYCTAQTSRLISNYPEFSRRDAEVLVVFPGPKEHVRDFVQSSEKEAQNAKTPFSIVLDEDFKAVNQLGIRGSLAKPSTYILDRAGHIRFAYVGASTADRPSIKAMLAQLDAIGKS